jgi:predicted nucleic acid-binding protein
MIAAHRYVLDTNVCIKQFIQDPLTAKANQLFDFLSTPLAEFYVPDLFYIECTNVMWKYVLANLYTVHSMFNHLQALISPIFLNLLKTQIKI